MTTPLPVITTASGPPLARGREATIHELGPGRVLRRYDDARDVSGEAALMRHVAGHGVRVPAVHALHAGTDGRPTGLVLERIDGPPLVVAAMRGTLSPADVGRTLARLHAELHRVPTIGLPTPADARPPGPGDVVVHLDLHPANVLLADGVPVIIDWAMARTGPATLDTAMTALVLAAAALAGVPPDAGDAAAIAVPGSAVRQMLGAYLAALDTPPTPSIDRAVDVQLRVAAQPPEVLRAAAVLVHRLVRERTG